MAVPTITSIPGIDRQCIITINGIPIGPRRELWDSWVIVVWLREAWPNLVTTTIANDNPASAKKPRKGAKKK